MCVCVCVRTCVYILIYSNICLNMFTYVYGR